MPRTCTRATRKLRARQLRYGTKQLRTAAVQNADKSPTHLHAHARLQQSAASGCLGEDHLRRGLC